MPSIKNIGIGNKLIILYNNQYFYNCNIINHCSNNFENIDIVYRYTVTAYTDYTNNTKKVYWFYRKFL